MTTHYKYRFSSNKPPAIHERLRKLFACWLTIVHQDMKIQDAEDQACYALDSPALIPAGSTFSEREYQTYGWNRTLTISARQGVIVRE